MIYYYLYITLEDAHTFGEKSMNDKMRYWGVVYLLSFLFLGLVFVSISWLVTKGWAVAPEVYMTLIIIAGVIALLASLTVTTVVISSLNMGDSTQALGLPRGSVRALIALSLIIVFSMTSIFLTNELRVVPYVDVNGSKTMREPSTEKVRFAQQLLTTVSTLVVAVSSFYFGTRSGEGTPRAVAEPNISVESPLSPFKMKRKQGEYLAPIIIKTTPSGEAVDWRVDGDKPDSLVQVKPYEFKYTQTEPEGNAVKLIFSLTKYPDKKDMLDVILEIND